MNQFRLVTMIAKTTPETHNPRISAETIVTHRLREIGGRLPYTMYVLYAAFFFWPSIYLVSVILRKLPVLKEAYRYLNRDIAASLKLHTSGIAVIF